MSHRLTNANTVAQMVGIQGPRAESSNLGVRGAASAGFPAGDGCGFNAGESAGEEVGDSCEPSAAGRVEGSWRSKLWPSAEGSSVCALLRGDDSGSELTVTGSGPVSYTHLTLPTKRIV
eukprot:TRINITY_DN2578_c0_g1_i11.p2 TRINITY_DN2578_c0_g1~~TRINITY_DN2578_c0_g1_i11.p2  ORF type:complete len:119 (-),score=14.78 TRINITY_DN2578_c0_g1_i11:35-391(-)